MDLSRVDFSLPVLDEKNSERLNPHNLDLKVAYGTPSWSFAPFAREFYPPRTLPKDRLKLYSHCFGAVELDSTFYALPRPETLELWMEQSTDAFQFCPKFPKTITHDSLLKNTFQETREFFDRMSLLGKRLGPALLQLPPEFSYDMGALLKTFVETSSAHRFAVEFRHPSWFENGKVKERVADFLCKHRVGLVVTDVAGRRDVCHSTLSAPFAVFRIQGNGLIESDFFRLRHWTDRLQEFHMQGLREAFVFLHQHEPVNNIAWAQRGLGLETPRVQFSFEL